MAKTTKIFIASFVLLVIYGVYYLTTKEPPKMTRDCIASHTEQLTVITYDVVLKMYRPHTQIRTICNTYSDWYVSPRWQRWVDKQGENQ